MDQEINLAKVMNGLIEAGSGEVLINGVVLNDETVYDARRAVGWSSKIQITNLLGQRWRMTLPSD